MNILKQGLPITVGDYPFNDSRGVTVRIGDTLEWQTRRGVVVGTTEMHLLVESEGSTFIYEMEYEYDEQANEVFLTSDRYFNIVFNTEKVQA